MALKIYTESHEVSIDGLKENYVDIVWEVVRSKTDLSGDEFYSRFVSKSHTVDIEARTVKFKATWTMDHKPYIPPTDPIIN